MADKSSAELLAALFSRFQRSAKAETGVKVSMRKFSEELLAHAGPRGASRTAGVAGAPGKPDANALGRWTNPGTKRNWFLPVARVLEVAEKLRASPSERDALMLARLLELANVEPGHEVLTCGAWVAERIQEQNRLDEDETAVLAAFRTARAVSPYAMMTAARVSRLEAVFEGMTREHLEGLAPDAAEAVEPDDAGPDGANLRERALAAVNHRGVKPVKSAQVSAEVVARRFLRRLKRSGA